MRTQRAIVLTRQSFSLSRRTGNRTGARSDGGDGGDVEAIELKSAAAAAAPPSNLSSSIQGYVPNGGHGTGSGTGSADAGTRPIESPLDISQHIPSDDLRGNIKPPNSGSPPKKKFGARSTTIYGYSLLVLIILVNAVLVICMNSLYVALMEGASSGIQLLGQVSAAAYRIAWGKIVVPNLLSMVDSKASYSSSQKTWVLLLMTIFNSVLAPCLATIVTDKRCLYDAFFGTAEVHSSYSIAYCDRVSPTSLNCQRVELLEVESVYSPSVVYNYQCSAAMLHNFVPVMIYSYSFVIFTSPFTYMLLTQVSPFWMAESLRSKLPWILWPLEFSDHSSSLFKPELILASLHSNIAVLLTFGL